jgi:hypothetical protein
MIEELQKIRDEFRLFYGLLPVQEISGNTTLLKKIQNLEQQLKEIIDAKHE